MLIDGLFPLSSALTQLGAALWLGARIVYLPLYAAGVPVLRSLVWLASLLGIALLLWPALMGEPDHLIATRIPVKVGA